jgi:hypothetical protein
MAFNAFATSSRDRIDAYELTRKNDERLRSQRGQSTGMKTTVKKTPGNHLSAAMTPFPYSSAQTPAYDGPSVNLSVLDARQFT